MSNSTQNDWAEDVKKSLLKFPFHIPQKYWKEIIDIVSKNRADARKEVIEEIDRDIRMMLDPYEYRGAITAQEAKEQTVTMIRRIMKATLKEESDNKSSSDKVIIPCSNNKEEK